VNANLLPLRLVTKLQLHCMSILEIWSVRVELRKVVHHRVVGGWALRRVVGRVGATPVGEDPPLQPGATGPRCGVGPASRTGGFPADRRRFCLSLPCRTRPRQSQKPPLGRVSLAFGGIPRPATPHE
jgi:hypothetical protein